MNILYVDMTSMNVEEVASLHEQLSYKLYDVRLEDLYDLKAKVEAAIKEKENGTNT